MLKALFGPSTLTTMLRGGLEEASATHRTIADRVAGAIASSSNTDFSDALQAQQSKQKVSAAELERDMASLADTQLRYEADAKLLQGAYARLRAALKERG